MRDIFRGEFRLGFTIVETLVVVTIILALAGLAMPVFSRVKLSGQMAQSKSNLRQVYVLVELYRGDNNEQIPYGNPDQMGLPTPDEFFRQTTRRGLVPPLANRYSNTGWYYYYPPDPIAEPQIKSKWESYVGECQAGSVFAADFAFSEVEPFIGSPYATKLGIGITLGGSIVVRRAPGTPFSPYWWPCNPKGSAP